MNLEWLLDGSSRAWGLGTVRKNFSMGTAVTSMVLSVFSLKAMQDEIPAREAWDLGFRFEGCKANSTGLQLMFWFGFVVIWVKG